MAPTDDADHPQDLVTLGEAAAELDVSAKQARAMVAFDLLVPSGGTEDDPLFTPAAVEAVRLAGG